MNSARRIWWESLERRNMGCRPRISRSGADHPSRPRTRDEHCPLVVEIQCVTAEDNERIPGVGVSPTRIDHRQQGLAGVGVREEELPGRVRREETPQHRVVRLRAVVRTAGFTIVAVLYGNA